MEGQDSDESRSFSSRARDAASRVTAPLTSATRAVTGKDVEQQVAEYTETLTQVALGLHEDLEASSRRIGILEANARNRSATPVAIAALAVALVALGVAIWVAV